MPTDLITAGPYGLIVLLAFYIVERLKKVETRLDLAEAANRKITRRFERMRAFAVQWRDDLRLISTVLLSGGLLSPEYLSRLKDAPEVADIVRAADAEA